MSNLRKGFHLMKLMKTQWKSYEQLKRLQEKKLRKILKHAYENIPLYHNKFKSVQIKPEDIHSVEDLIKIPFLTKDEIQNNFPTGIVLADINISKCWTPHTSGSTGKPLKIVYDDRAEDFEKACALRPNLSCGQRPFDKWVVITSPGNIQYKLKEKQWFQRFGLFSQDCISLFEETKNQISFLEKTNPDILDGYSSSIYLVANELKTQSNLRIKPKIVYGTSDLLTKKMRDVINSVFNVEMFDQFGSVEMGRTAWECPQHSGYHMDMEAVVMEFIRDNEQVSQGERGEIVYTNLFNYAMPFIRYKIEDVGIPTDEKCSCGRGLPLMKLIEGRKDAFIKLADGKIISPIVWTIILRPYNLKQYKVIQETENKIKIQIIPREGVDKSLPETIYKNICLALGSELPIEFELVNEIPREKSGKVRSVISKINVDW